MNLKLLPVLFCACLAWPAFSLPEDEDKELVIRSHTAEMDRRTGIVIYQGNVVLTQGTLRIEADQLQIQHSGNILQRAVADGKPARYQQQITADKPVTHAEGKRIEYLSQQKEVIVSGNAILKQGGDQFSGERLTYDMTAETVKANGGAATTAEGKAADDNSRVHMIIQPQKDSPATTEGKDEASAQPESETPATRTEPGNSQ